MDDTETDAVAELAREGMTSELVKCADGREFLISHDTKAVKDVSDEHGLHIAKPRYTQQTVALQTTVSLADYVNRYKLPETTIFADIANDRIDAIVDYHGPSQADHGAHRANMKLNRSEEWKLWAALHQKGLIGQLEFARFIEENANDVHAPEAGVLLDTVRDLQGHRKVNFIKAVRTASDNENFEFTVDNEAKTKGGIEIPNKFVIRIPVYFCEPPVEINAFLRWKIDPEAGGLSLGIALNRPEFVRQEEFQRIVREIGDATERPVVFGTLA